MGIVFISYVREDAAFARYLVAALRAAADGIHEELDPWLDEERLAGGDILEEDLATTIATADCGVFLVAPRFFKSDHCMNELRIFAERFPGKRRVPILRRPRAELDIPAHLGGRPVTVDWVDGETDRDEAIHQVLCAIRDIQPGPRSEWAKKGRTATAKLPAEYFAPSPVQPKTTPRLAGPDLKSLKCDRAREWSLIEDIYPQPCHHVVLIGGTRADAHDLFVLRIEHYLRNEPPFRSFPVDWRKRPKTKGEYLERIARALVPAGPVDLVAELRRCMTTENLILIHNAIDRKYEDETVRSYYGEWLPELMKEVAPVRSLKCIQPVVWDLPSRLTAMARQSTERFFGKAPAWMRSASEQKGRAFMDDVCAQERESTEMIPFVLGPVGDEDIRNFCRSERVSKAECEQLLEEIHENDVTEPIAVFEYLDDFMRRRQKTA